MVKLNPSPSFQAQSFWGLTSILGSAFGLPVIIIGGQLAKIHGNGIALTSVFIGNFILWLIGFVIISMVGKKDHALENVKNYLGKTTSVIAEMIWIFAFLMWYVLQLNETTKAIGAFSLNKVEHVWVLGGLLGFITALLSIGGIRFIKNLSVIGFPFLLAFAIYSITTASNSMEFTKSWGFSFSGILSVILIWLPFTVNLPTIFRYSQSKAHSVIGLSLISISRVFFQIFAILVAFDDPMKWSIQYSGHISLIGIMAFMFIIVSYTIVNMLNVYLTMPESDAIVFRQRHRIKYFTIGLVGTGLYLFSKTFPYSPSIPFGAQFLEGILSSFIANLGIVLLFDFLIKAITQHRPRPLEKFCSSVCWLVGCLSSIIAQATTQSNPQKATLIGIATCALMFLTIVFLEETIWSIQETRKNKIK